MLCFCHGKGGEENRPDRREVGAGSDRRCGSGSRQGGPSPRDDGEDSHTRGDGGQESKGGRRRPEEGAVEGRRQMARILLRGALAARETKTAEPPPAKQSRKSKSTRVPQEGAGGESREKREVD